MTPQQIELARHALGLPNRNNQSYRNHFVAGREHSDYADWQAMVIAGNAVRRDGKRLLFGGDDLFHLSQSGAETALMPGERLGPGDFPASARRPNEGP